MLCLVDWFVILFCFLLLLFSLHPFGFFVCFVLLFVGCCFCCHCCCFVVVVVVFVCVRVLLFLLLFRFFNLKKIWFIAVLMCFIAISFYFNILKIRSVS